MFQLPLPWNLFLTRPYIPDFHNHGVTKQHCLCFIPVYQEVCPGEAVFCAEGVEDFHGATPEILAQYTRLIPIYTTSSITSTSLI